jgi:hypothetical protein
MNDALTKDTDMHAVININSKTKLNQKPKFTCMQCHVEERYASTCEWCEKRMCVGCVWVSDIGLTCKRCYTDRANYLKKELKSGRPYRTRTFHHDIRPYEDDWDIKYFIARSGPDGVFFVFWHRDLQVVLDYLYERNQEAHSYTLSIA